MLSQQNFLKKLGINVAETKFTKKIMFQRSEYKISQGN